MVINTGSSRLKRRVYIRGVISIVLVLMLAVIVGYIIKLEHWYFVNRDNCSMAQATKVLAYMCGYDKKSRMSAGVLDEYWYTDYYRYMYEIGVFDEESSLELSPDKALMGKDIRKVLDFIGVEAEVYDYRAYDNTSFIELLKQYSEYFPKGNSLLEQELSIVGTSVDSVSDSNIFVNPYIVATNKGNYGYKGIELNNYKDKTINVLTIDQEIVFFIGLTSDKADYNNVWIEDFSDSVLYINMYGVKRAFNIAGTSEDVVGMLADISVDRGRLVGITVKKNITDRDIRVLIYNTEADSPYYDSVTVCKDGVETVYTKDNVSEDGVRISSAMGNQIQLSSITRGQGKPSYEGIIELRKDNDKLVIINEIAIENYLKRVVPSEMPEGFGLEALKVQAICARSYAYVHLDDFGYPQYKAHMDDTINYQVYNNTAEKELTNQAIADTCGRMIYYADRIISTYYYSTSCGIGTDVSLWGSSSGAYPYYVSKAIGTAIEDVDYTVEENFRKYITNTNESDYDYGTNYYRWKAELTADDIESRLEGKYQNIGDITNINVRKRVSGGAVKELNIEGMLGSLTLESEGEIRGIFGLASAFFIVDKTEDKYCFTGGGYGHGIGMSQYAVKAMTSSGMSYKDVLSFFYPGTSVY